ncbi:hypothetical protein [Afifella sp. IM 167]|uniref:hypothetical protein n=1 Tax=Afifella sp. IM 167 TaxID=2033586 RepID=UPI001CD02D9D|nr:hypothetical protein [Afifella sp. IM 167]MBZ8134697.1 hypothetical protein [Afifella sp. IM 167]
MKRRSLAAAAAAALLAACSSGAKDYLSYSAGSEPHAVASRIADAMRQCWFAGDAAFSGFIYAPEINSYSGRPRILILRKGEPGGLPQLVVGAEADGRGSEVKLFGPLLATASGPRIRADIARWSAGNTTCGA